MVIAGVVFCLTNVTTRSLAESVAYTVPVPAMVTPRGSSNWPSSVPGIGEATKNVSPGFRARHPGIPWKGMAGLRDRLVHHYFGVDYDAVWATITEDLPEIETRVRAALETADT
ncbi:MAG: HepT-like ribonuclease domain-containing protein [Methanospirillum sp.]